MSNEHTPYVQHSGIKKQAKKPSRFLAASLNFGIVYVFSVGSTLMCSLLLKLSWTWFVLGRFATRALSFADAVSCVVMFGVITMPLTLAMLRNQMRELIRNSGGDPNSTKWQIAISVGVLAIIHPAALFTTWAWSLFLST